MSPISSKKEKSKLTIEFNIEDMTPAQVRLIRSLNTILAQVVLSSEEGEFFDGSAEFLRMAAALIKQSKFTNQMETTSEIPYDEQVLEFSVEILQEQINNAKVVTYDN